MDIAKLLTDQLIREYARHDSPTRAGEGLFGLCMDLRLEPQKVLGALAQLEVHPAAILATRRLLTENETLEVLTRERLLARRSAPKAVALALARAFDTEGLRRVSGKDLQLALRAASVAEAKAIIEAWNALSVFEQTRG